MSIFLIPEVCQYDSKGNEIESRNVYFYVDIDKDEDDKLIVSLY